LESKGERRRKDDLKFRLALRAAQIGIWDLTLDTGEMEYSAKARAIYGFHPDVPITIDMVRAATHPADLPSNTAQAQRALDPQVKERAPFEYRILRADTGALRWVVVHGEPIFATTPDGPVAVRYVGTVQDITERKEVEQALRDSELRQRLAIDAARMAVWEFDAATGRLTASAELNRMFGMPADAHPTIDDLRAAYGPGEREKVQEAAQAALERGDKHFEAEFRCRRPDGNLYWLMLRAEVMFAPDGSFERVIGVLMDIDDSKRSQERQTLLLRELNHRVKNSLSVVQSLATQSFRKGNASPAALTAFRDRLSALARANDVLFHQEWTAFSLAELVQDIIDPYDDGDGRFDLEGADITLPPRLNVPLALTLHELCTNAAKYGALSAGDGQVRIEWTANADGLELTWIERGGPAVATPIEPGFGARLISNILAVELGRVELDPQPEGMRCRMFIAGRFDAAGNATDNSA